MAGWTSGLAGWPKVGDGQMDRWTDGRTYQQKISPFYRTLSPIGAAALPAPMKTKVKLEQGKGTADHLMPLGYFFRTINDNSSRCLQEAVDEQFQQTLQCITMHKLSFNLPSGLCKNLLTQ